MIKPFIIDLEIKKACLEMSANFGESVRRILRDGGMTETEIKELMHDVIKDIKINGVPVLAVGCVACNGRGWIMPDEKD
jgi:hypothetical protein